MESTKNLWHIVSAIKAVTSNSIPNTTQAILLTHKKLFYDLLITCFVNQFCFAFLKKGNIGKQDGYEIFLPVRLDQVITLDQEVYLVHR